MKKLDTGVLISRLLVLLVFASLFVIATSVEVAGTFTAVCHYDSSTDTWIQEYSQDPGAIHLSCGPPDKEQWCKWKPGPGVFQDMCSRVGNIPGLIASNPDSYWSPCIDEAIGDGYFCLFEVGTHSAVIINEADEWQTMLDFPGSHRGPCTGHELHTMDYIGSCIGINVTPAPSDRSPVRKREGAGTGVAIPHKRGFNPRTEPRTEAR